MFEEDNFYDETIKVLQEISKKPSDFLQMNEIFCNTIKDNLKKTYDFTRREAIKSVKSDALRELVVLNFDLEQIWQQIELQNDSIIGTSVAAVSKLVVNKAGLSLGNEEEVSDDKSEIDDNKSEKSEVNDNDNESSSVGDSLEDLGSESNDEEAATNKPKSILKASVVDDEFFKLSEMEKFLVTEEKREAGPDPGIDSEESESESSVDLFETGSVDEEDEGKSARYKDFFVEQETVKKIRNKFMDLEENQQSSFELKQKRLNKKIEELEEEALEDKTWQMKGEITADSRPQNSLLEEIVEFDLTSRPAPVITEQTTMQLEDIIKQRIKDKVFDSVERKAKPTETPLEYKKKLVLDQEKSKESLAQIYEKEYLEQQASFNQENTETDKEPELHQEINSLMKNLFNKLDALSNFHFTPKPAIPELKIISNLPAISMEEVAPVAASDAALLAPEEVKGKTKGDLVGKSERTTTDKKRERRKKKLKQKIHAKERQKKIKPGLGNKYSKEKVKKLLEKVAKEKNVDKIDAHVDAVKSSKAFFTQLQEEVKSQIKRKSTSKVSKKDKNHSAKRLKL